MRKISAKNIRRAQSVHRTHPSVLAAGSAQLASGLKSTGLVGCTEGYAQFDEFRRTAESAAYIPLFEVGSTIVWDLVAKQSYDLPGGSSNKIKLLRIIQRLCTAI